MKSKLIIPAVLILILIIGFFAFKTLSSSSGSSAVPTPTPPPESAEQLSAENYPQASLLFSTDGHYVTINLSNLHATSLEYNLIYDAVVKDKSIQTGVTGSAILSDAQDYSNKQLLGSESSGKFTYHEDISNAVLELTLRDDNGYSIFSAVYPFIISAGESVDLTPSE